MPGPDTHDLDALAGAMYFVVGLATEGGPSPYHLTVAGLTFRGAEPRWGDVEEVAADSGYSIGTIQVDLGKRGTWPLGATTNAALQAGQTTYVDALIAQAATYAQEHHLGFADDKGKLRAQLLSHGDGKGDRSALSFIDTVTRDSFNAWAASSEGQRWIHRNIDYPQIRNATKQALEILDSVGRNISEDRRFETIALLTKTANQRPAELRVFRDVLARGGNYDDVLAKALEIEKHNRYYAGAKAAHAAGLYAEAYGDHENAVALNRAQMKVGSPHFDPARFAVDEDLQLGLSVSGSKVAASTLRPGSRGQRVSDLQNALNSLGITADGRPLRVDAAFGPSTREALQAFQRAQGLDDDGLAGPETLQALREAARQQSASLADRRHPGHPLFCQAMEQVHRIDARCGRTPDKLSCNLAGALAVAAQAQGLGRIDYVMLGQNATRAIAVQGELDSPRRRMVGVDLLQAVATPLEQSSAGLLTTPQQREAALPAVTHPQALSQPALQEIIR